MALSQLFTIGYEAADPEDFIATLKHVGINTLLDIRELAISRRKGFAKNALRQSLQEAAIQYHHEPRLGSPKDIRDRLRSTGDYNAFFRDFDNYLSGQQALLKSLADELDGAVVLLCYERDHTECHRRSVARALQGITHLKPKHLGVHPHARKAPTHPRPHLGESLSPA